MKNWVQKNISDYSGFQHLQRCLIRLSQYYDNSFSDFYGISRKDILEKTNINTHSQNQDLKNKESHSIVSLWHKEIQFTKDLILRYPGHESLWYHLRFLSFGWIWLKLLGYLIEFKFDDNDEEVDYNSIVKKWPELESELEFSHYCICQIDQDNHERFIIQKQSALAFELWISELVNNFIYLSIFTN
jgi:protein prenyltransferase alpha subunit repeat containing protein 1